MEYDASSNLSSTLALERMEQERISLIQEVHAKRNKLRHLEQQLANRSFNANDHSEGRSSPTPIRLWLFSGIINGVLKLLFCIVFAVLIYDAAPHLLKDTFLVLCGTQLTTSTVTCLVTALYSSASSSISGPDIVHALFLSAMMGTVAKKTSDPEAALATILFLICFTSLCISLTWLVVAKYRLTVVIDFFPVAVVTGFLGCVGYKVIKSSVKIAVGKAWYYFLTPNSGEFWVLLLPALPLGICMYLLKRFHIGSPLVILPYFILVPVVVFYLCVGASQQTMEDVRGAGWMFDEFQTNMFWEQWSRLHFHKIQWDAVLETLPDTLVLVIIVTLDALMYLKKNKREMNMNVQMDLVHELNILGFQNLLSVLCVGPVGYPLYEMTVLINYSITNNAHEKRPTLIVAAICGVSWLCSIAIIVNVLPRFFLSGLLIYAGLPFLELIVAAYWRLTKKEFATVLAIVFTNFFFELFKSTKTHALVIAMLLGFLLSSLVFVLQYAKTSVIRDSLSGKDYQSSVVRSYQEQLLVERLGARYAIIELEGYIFFGSCNQLVHWAKEKIRENDVKSNAEKLKYIIVDLKHVENIDYTGSAAFSRVLVPLLLDCCSEVIFSDMSPKVRGKLSDVFQSKQWNQWNQSTQADQLNQKVKEFHDLDHASEYVENLLLNRAACLRKHWLLFPSFSRLHTQAVLKNTYEIFEAILGGQQVGNRLWKYAEQLKFPQGYFITREGRFNHTLYLLQKGKVTTFRDEEDKKGRGIHRIRTMFRGAFVNEECLFSDRPVADSTVTNQECLIWAIDREQQKKMEAQDPNLMAAILRYVLSTSSLAKNRLEREVSAIDQSVPKSKQQQQQQATTTNTHFGNFGNRLLQEIRDMHEHHVAEVHDVELDEHFAHVTGSGAHHLHHFHHMNVDIGEKNGSTFGEASPPMSPSVASKSWASVRPHLSTTERRDAIECFLFHSILDETAVKDEWEVVQDNVTHEDVTHEDVTQEGMKEEGRKEENVKQNKVQDNSHVRKRRGSLRARSFIDITKKTSRAVLSTDDTGLSNLNEQQDEPLRVPELMLPPTKANEGTVKKITKEMVNGGVSHIGGAAAGGGGAAATSVGGDGGSKRSPSPLGRSVTAVFEEHTRKVTEGKFISLEEVQRAVMDLGMFPTSEEIDQLHEKCSTKDHHVRHHGSADVEEFLKIVTSLSVKEMGSSTVNKLHRLFVNHSDDEQRLWRVDLPSLMNTLNHPEDELEMEALFKEWDIEMRGYLDFDAFVSIVAHLLKHEELDEQLERDFLLFCGEKDVDHPSLQQMHSFITPANVVRVARAHNVFIDHRTAEEMVHDADETGSGKLSLDSLIACIETVSANEEYTSSSATIEAHV